MKKVEIVHGLIFALLSMTLLYVLHFLPVNQLFIDPFSEAIKTHDIMDVAFSKFRDHKDPGLFDDDILILNSENTNRLEIANAIDFLIRQDVKAIGIDLLFDSLYYDRTDSLLRKALGNEKVVLGYTIDEHKEHEFLITGEMKSAKYFSDKAHRGFVNLASDDGFSVRAFQPYCVVNGTRETSFALRLSSLVDANLIELMDQRGHEKEWINFRRKQPGSINMKYPINGEALTHYAYTSVKSFVRDSSSYSRSYLANKVVLIGFNGDGPKVLSMKDRYYTPLNQKYQGRSLPDMHGVVIHANVISMLLNKDFINEVPQKYLYLGTFLIFFINFFLFKKILRKKFVFVVFHVRAIQLLQFILLFSFCLLMVTKFNVKIGFILIITSVVLSFELFEFYSKKLKKPITSLFNKKKNYSNENI